MDCDLIEEKLELYVLDGLSEGERDAVAAHIRVCAQCRAAEAEYRELTGQVRGAITSPVPDESFERALTERVGGEIASIRRRGRRSLALRVALATAASVLLALGIWQAVRALSHQAQPVAQTPRTSIPQVWQLVGAHAVATSSADAVVINGHRMYILLNDGPLGRVAALDIASGKELWRSQVQSAGYMAADDSLVYCLVPGKDRGMDFVALRANTGELAWRCSPPAMANRASPVRPVVLAGGRVCLSNDAVISVIDASNGSLLWSKPVEGEGLVSGAEGVGSRLYFASSKALYCLDSGGAELWRMPLDQPASGFLRPLVAATRDGVCVVAKEASGNDRVVCVDPTGPRLAWDRPAPRITSLLAADGCIFARGQNVRALDGKTGDELWSCKAAGCGAMTYLDGHIYFVDSSKPGRLVALDAKSGLKTWELTGLASCDAFNRVGDTGYVKTQDGVVRAIALAAPARGR